MEVPRDLWDQPALQQEDKQDQVQIEWHIFPSISHVRRGADFCENLSQENGIKGLHCPTMVSPWQGQLKNIQSLLLPMRLRITYIHWTGGGHILTAAPPNNLSLSRNSYQRYIRVISTSQEVGVMSVSPTQTPGVDGGELRYGSTRRGLPIYCLSQFSKVADILCPPTQRRVRLYLPPNKRKPSSKETLWYVRKCRTVTYARTR